MKMFVALLWVGCLASAMGAVYAEFMQRKYVLAHEQAVQHRDELEIEWERLRIEESSLAAHARIDRVARERLHMRAPEYDAIVRVIR